MDEVRLQEIHDKARKEHVPIMLDDGMEFLLEYIRSHEGIRDILEIGTAVGYSAIQMASLRWDMTIDTVEINPVMYEQAKIISCMQVCRIEYMHTYKMHTNLKRRKSMT